MIDFQRELPQGSVGDTVLEEGWSVLRTLRLPEGEITLVAVHVGYGWKATVESPALYVGLEFHGLFPRTALDQAEAFIRRTLAAAPVGPHLGH